MMTNISSSILPSMAGPGRVVIDFFPGGGNNTGSHDSSLAM